MIVKKTKQLGNFKRGVNLYIPKRRSAAAPSGIPVASTNTINVVDGSGYGWDGNYQKETSTQYKNESNAYHVIFWDGFEWSLYDNDSSVQVFPVPQSNNINYIATTGWPTQTLAAA